MKLRQTCCSPFALGLMVAGSILLIPARLQAEDSPAASSSPEYQTSVIEQIWNDGTLILRNGQKVKLPMKALKHPAVRAQKPIVIYSKQGPHVDAQGRLQGWVLVLDRAKKVDAILAHMREEAAVTASLPEKQAMPDMGRPITLGQDFAMASRSTVSPPVGQGLEILAQSTASLSRGGTAFLENGRRVKIGKNVFLDNEVKEDQRLVFFAR